MSEPRCNHDLPAGECLRCCEACLRDGEPDAAELCLSEQGLTPPDPATDDAALKRPPPEPTRPVLEWHRYGEDELYAKLSGYWLVAKGPDSREPGRYILSYDGRLEEHPAEPILEATQVACERAARRVLREALAKLEGRGESEE